MKTIIIKNISIAYVILVIFKLVSCNNYLEIKPDKKLATPHTSKDLQAILDNISRINNGEQGLSEIASDNFFLPYENWLGIDQIENREAYIWQKTPVADLYWEYMYRKIYDANLVMDYIDKVTYQMPGQRDFIYGNARLVRAIAFQKLADVFTVPFHINMDEGKELGVVLKLSSDINELNQRSSLKATHLQIQEDFKEAINHLPEHFSDYPTRPSKASAYAAFARYLISIQDYSQALKYAKLSLELKSTLSNYNTIIQKPFPFDLYNVEILYYSQLISYRNLSEANARVDTVLFNSYDTEDIRKALFFTKQKDNYHSFTGDYSKNDLEKFSGLTTAEMYLISAECNARLKKVEEAEQDLITLLKMRYKTNYNFTTWNLKSNSDQLLQRILLERRKELIGRGVRWQDIRRISFDQEVVLKRVLRDKTYILDSKMIKSFAFQLPHIVINRGNYIQN